MLNNMILGLFTMAACMVVQALLVALAVRFYLRRHQMSGEESVGKTMVLIVAVMMVLVVGNFIQIGIWALVFKLVGEFPGFNTAFYHSAVNFASLGYGDIVMSGRNKLLGPLEAINGMLMLGLSTAILMAFFQDALRKFPKRRGK